MNEWLDDLRTAVTFLTRLPIPHPESAPLADFARAQRGFPLVGAAIGAAIGLVCLGMRVIGVPDLAAAAVALGAGALLTRSLDEDGLAGVTGDVLGATEQVCETAILVLFAAWLA